MVIKPGLLRPVKPVPALAARTLNLPLNGSIGAGTFSRNSNAWNPETGAVAPHNVFLNSATGVTQSITLTAVPQVLSFKGTGSITITGTGSGTLAGTGATNRVSLAFTPTAGSATFTVTGTCTEVQVNQYSLTDYVVTVGSAVYSPRYVSGGMLIEESSTNVFLNSQGVAAVTQNIALTTAGTGKWTCSVFGAGTVTSSAGTATATGYGAATVGTPNTITVTGNGTVTYTVAGATAATIVNVENLPYATSPIVTGSGTVTRPAETLTHAAATFLTAATGTVACWTRINLAIQASATTKMVFDHRTPTNNIAMYKSTASRYEVFTANNAGTISTFGVTTTLTAGWHHFAVSWANPGKLQFWIDGLEQAGTITNPNVPANLAASFSIGYQTSSSAQADQTIDSLMIYNRPLTAPEVLQLYRSDRR